ncbi:MAG: DUF3800 domain-containing protein [Candidatus Gribaldobacteria bacterium]|nr:DUF3800 domain-containing protein [Candidatus Gribaldobacteria bacterium]
MQKLYCYVDETGQDTKGRLFLVAVVVLVSDRENLRAKLRKAEQVSGKGIKKWMKATHKQHEQYIKQIISDSEFSNAIFYTRYDNARNYVDLTILSTAKAILGKAKSPYTAIVFVDGLGRPERHRFAAGLRKLKVNVKKVRGIRDQSDEFARLADAAAGFVRDNLQGDGAIQKLCQTAKRNGIIKEI